MAKPQGICVVCGGSPTVQAHLFPRALMLDMRRGSQHLVTGYRDRKGVRFKQNGEWDDRFLCEAHENQIGFGDDYGVKFCRNWSSRAEPYDQGKALALPNDRPELLMHFAYAVIWRHAASDEGGNGPDLGPFEAPILQALLDSGPYSLKLMLGLSPLVIDGRPANVAVPPHRMRISNRNSIQFAVSGLTFYLKTDRQEFPSDWAPFLANDNKVVIVSALDPMRLQDIPKLKPILRNMRDRGQKGR